MSKPTEHPPRTGPIVWGVIILGVCCAAVFQLLRPSELDPVEWITVSSIALGVLLLGAGIATLVRNSRVSKKK